MRAVSPATLVAPTRILIVGHGAREHALAWKLAGEPGVNSVLVLPGSHAIDAEARVEAVTRMGRDSILDGRIVASIARGNATELVVVGPEAPLAAGVVDILAAEGVTVFGPTAAAARIESSKSFCREVAEAAGVPMARGRTFLAGERAAAVAFAGSLASDGAGVVVKADGLAAGKGVTVCDDLEAAAAAIAGIDGPCVVEERLRGREVSLIALVDGSDALALPFARDHKRLRDGDDGPNTGGMGAFSPVPDVPDESAEGLLERFHRPVLAELARRGAPFRGALYAGLMMTSDGPRLLEFNARFGDPEAQVILPRIGVPLGPLLLAAARGRLADARRTLGLDGSRLPVQAGATVGIVLAAEGYPDAPIEGAPITGIDDAVATGALVFHAGTGNDDTGGWRVRGGRVLTVVGRGRDLASARDAAELAADRIDWSGMQRRHDIAADATVAAGAGR